MRKVETIRRDNAPCFYDQRDGIASARAQQQVCEDRPTLSAREGDGPPLRS
jgi:hypothetical protein